MRVSFQLANFIEYPSSHEVIFPPRVSEVSKLRDSGILLYKPAIQLAGPDSVGNAPDSVAVPETNTASNKLDPEARTWRSD